VHELQVEGSGVTANHSHPGIDIQPKSLTFSANHTVAVLNPRPEEILDSEIPNPVGMQCFGGARRGKQVNPSKLPWATQQDEGRPLSPGAAAEDDLEDEDPRTGVGRGGVGVGSASADVSAASSKNKRIPRRRLRCRRCRDGTVPL
jgi:hypothetical protein